MAADFTDETPAPTPAPKKHFHCGSGVLGPIPWTAGQTFAQAMNAAFPAGMKARVNVTDFVIHIDVVADEL